jgi:hypothetical protein
VLIPVDRAATYLLSVVSCLYPEFRSPKPTWPSRSAEGEGRPLPHLVAAVLHHTIRCLPSQSTIGPAIRLATSTNFQHQFRIPRSARCVPRGRVFRTGAQHLHLQFCYIQSAALLSMPTAKHFVDRKHSCCWKRRRRGLSNWLSAGHSNWWTGDGRPEALPKGSTNDFRSKSTSYLRPHTAFSSTEAPF